jgi:putative addiction module component (TIGR02574 family)
MTTITIENGEMFSRTRFTDLDDLQEYITKLKPDLSISAEQEKELDRRYEELISGKVDGVPWEDVKAEFSKRFDS